MVVSAVPFHRTVAPVRKLVPFTVSVKAASPAATEAGLRLVMLGVGALMGNVTVAEGLPPALSAAMLPLPAVAIRLAGTAAVS